MEFKIASFLVFILGGLSSLFGYGAKSLGSSMIKSITKEVDITELPIEQFNKLTKLFNKNNGV